MKNVDRRAARRTNFQRLVDRFQQLVALVPHVCVVATAGLSGDLAQGGNFFGGGVNGRRINERRGNSCCAGMHCFADKCLHAAQLFGRRAAINVADHQPPHMRVAHRLGNIHRQPFQVEQLEILGHALPARVASLARIERRCRNAFAGVDSGDSLPQQIQPGSRIPQNRGCRLTHHIDETGGNDQPFRVDHLLRFRRIDPADLHNLAVSNANVTAIPRTPAAIDDATRLDNNVESLGCRGSLRTNDDG
jgi:hypothetical protein